MLRYLILALLRQQPDHGYRLKRRFDDRTGGAWLLNIGQVYQTLQALERTGLVTGVVPPGGQAPARRRVFEITVQGTRALEQWLRRPVSRRRPVRDEILLRLLASTPGHHVDLLPEIAAQERLCRERVQRLVALLPDPDRSGEPVYRLSLEAELLHLLAQLAWLERCRQQLPHLRGPDVEAQEDDSRHADALNPACAVGVGIDAAGSAGARRLA